MSTLKIINLQHPSNVNNNVVLDANGNMTCTGTVVGGSSMGMRNRIINGDMRIDQRNGGASVTPTAGGYFTVDRYRPAVSQSSKFSIQQVTDAPSGFTNSIKVTSLSSYSVTSGDYFCIQQRIEGYNVSDFAFGTSSAKTITLSFWVKSSLTGTFGGSINNNTLYNRSYPFSYTISSANTWEQKTITISGDTTGTWNTDNTTGMIVGFALGYGSTYGSGTAGAWVSGDVESVTGAVSVVGTSGATFYITGVQLEVGTAATPFERRQYGHELALCQRYYQTPNVALQNGQVRGVCGYGGNATGIGVTYFPVEMRTQPTITITNASWQYYSAGGAWTSCTLSVYRYINNQTTGGGLGAELGATTDANGGVRLLRNVNADVYLTCVAEL